LKDEAVTVGRRFAAYRYQVLTSGSSERREDESEGLRKHFDFEWQRPDRFAVEFQGHLGFCFRTHARRAPVADLGV
jgi:hypothetical protein